MDEKIRQELKKVKKAHTKGKLNTQIFNKLTTLGYAVDNLAGTVNNLNVALQIHAKSQLNAANVKKVDAGTEKLRKVEKHNDAKQSTATKPKKKNKKK